MKCKRESDGRKIDHHTLQVMRQQAVKAVKSGQTVESVAAAFGVSKRAVFGWLAKFASGGQNALLAKPVPGRPPKITAEEMRWIAQALKDHTPQQLKFEFGLWTLSLVGELIKRQFGETLALASVSRVMKLLGFTVQKPLYQAWQQDPVLVRQWESEEYPAIKAEAKAVGATIYFADESGIRSDYHTGTTWAPCGETPVVSVTGARFSLNMISALSPRGDFRFMVHEGSVTAPVFKAFLQRLMVGATQPVFVVVDGHPIHKAAMVRKYVQSQEGMLKLFVTDIEGIAWACDPNRSEYLGDLVDMRGDYPQFSRWLYEGTLHDLEDRLRDYWYDFDKNSLYKGSNLGDHPSEKIWTEGGMEYRCTVYASKSKIFTPIMSVNPGYGFIQMGLQQTPKPDHL